MFKDSIKRLREAQEVLKQIKRSEDAVMAVAWAGEVHGETLMELVGRMEVVEGKLVYLIDTLRGGQKKVRDQVTGVTQLPSTKTG